MEGEHGQRITTVPPSDFTFLFPFCVSLRSLPGALWAACGLSFSLRGAAGAKGAVGVGEKAVKDGV